MKNHNVILAYHSVGENPVAEAGAELYSLRLDSFVEQMEYVRRMTNGVSQTMNVMVTFDDGDITNYTNVFPVLKKMGLKAHFFVIGGKIGTPGYMGWESIKLLRDAGMAIGSHGMTHRILTELSDEELAHELNVSKKILSDILGTAVDTFSIPRGFCDGRIVEAARKAGYKAIFTSNVNDNDGFKFGRIVVRPNWDKRHFVKVLNNGYLLRDRAEGFIKNSMKKILGASIYDKIRTRILKPMSCEL